MKLSSLLELISVTFVASQQPIIDPIIDSKHLCGDLLSRGNGLVEQKYFFTDKNLALYETLYKCNLGASKRGEFADKKSLHDQDASADLEDYFTQYPAQERIGIMGGSDLDRDTSGYHEVALLSKRLSESDYTIITGGGPGAMEAAHVGAWFACRSDEDLNNAIKMLSTVPKYAKNEWLRTATEVQDKYPRLSPTKDVAITTFVYGHRPPTSFASKLTTYFSEPLREEAILLSSTGAMIFTPGGAGTDEEVLESIKYNTYRGAYKDRPLILFKSGHWNEKFSSKILSKAITADSVDDVISHINPRSGTCSKSSLKNEM